MNIKIAYFEYDRYNWNHKLCGTLIGISKYIVYFKQQSVDIEDASFVLLISNILMNISRHYYYNFVDTTYTITKIFVTYYYENTIYKKVIPPLIIKWS